MPQFTVNPRRVFVDKNKKRHSHGDKPVELSEADAKLHVQRGVLTPVQEEADAAAATPPTSSAKDTGKGGSKK